MCLSKLDAVTPTACSASLARCLHLSQGSLGARVHPDVTHHPTDVRVLCGKGATSGADVGLDVLFCDAWRVTRALFGACLHADSALVEDTSLGHVSYVQQVLIDQKVTQVWGEARARVDSLRIVLITPALLLLQVFITGLLLERAVLHTAVDVVAMLPDASVFVIEDGCKGFNAALAAEALKKVRKPGVGVTAS